MMINLTQKIKDFEGTVIKRGDKNITLRDILVETLLTDKQTTTNEDKMNKWVLVKKLRDAKDSIDLSIDELAKIKEEVISYGTTLIAGQVSDILEGAKK